MRAKKPDAGAKKKPPMRKAPPQKPGSMLTPMGKKKRNRTRNIGRS